MKRHKIYSLSVALLMSATVAAQTGGITPKMMGEIQKQTKKTPAENALANAIAANSIDKLAKNRNNAAALDTYFSVETPKQSITDQQSSGRCWMFSGMNVLRAHRRAMVVGSLKIYGCEIAV